MKHIRSIRTSGTILPSSRFLVGNLLDNVDFAGATEIVELGVGTGCVTREILRRMRTDARLVSLEINPAFVRACRSIRDPRLTLVEACAADLPQVLACEGVGRVDAIVSSLPLAIMPDDLVERILDVSRDSLRPGGHFFQYQYSLSHRARLGQRYEDVAVGFTLLNVPPAFVYACSREGGGNGGPARTRPSLGAAYAAVLAAVGVAVRVYQNL